MRIAGIERLRAIAIAMVYLVHAQVFGYLKPLRFLGTWAGVDLFFVISGFVVTLSLERMIPEREQKPLSEPVSADDVRALRTFYVRRLFRLGPVAALALSLHLAGAAFAPFISADNGFGTVRSWAFETAAIMTGLYNFVAPYLAHPPMIFFWSLSVEEQFYCLLPSLFLLAPNRRKRTLAALSVLVLVSAVIRPLFSPDNFQIACCMSQFRFDSLAAGVVLALQRERLSTLATHVGPMGRRALVVLSLGAVEFISHREQVHFAMHRGLTFIWMASAVLVACAAVDSRDVFDLPVVNRVLEYLGSRSYAIYVIHSAFILLDEAIATGVTGRFQTLVTSRGGETVRFFLTAGLVLAVAELAHRYVELPAIAAGKRYAARLRAASQPASSVAA